MAADEDYRQRAADWFASLRARICAEFEMIEDEFAANSPGGPSPRFDRCDGERPGGGGGAMAIMKGSVFEKVGVNVSVVREFATEFRNEIPGAAEAPVFPGREHLTGIAPVLTTGSGGAYEHAPHHHQQSLVCGGSDLTPIYPDEPAAADFHAALRLRRACEGYEPDAYAKHKKWCDEYSFLPRRNEPRGAGGIFFDYLDSADWQRDFAFARSVGDSFLAAYAPIVRDRMRLSWADQ